MEDIRKGTCPLCRHNEIVEAPMQVRGEHGWYAMHLVPGRPELPTLGLSKREPSGRVMLYACRRCGYFQSYIAHCDAVPIGPDHDTRIIKGPEPEGPYR